MEPQGPRPDERLRWAARLIDSARHDLLSAASLIDGAACDCHGEDADRHAVRGVLAPLAEVARSVFAASAMHKAEDEATFGD